MNTFSSDNSHGRLEINEKLIKSELVQNTVTLDSSFFWKILFFFCYCFLSFWPKCKAISSSEIRHFHWFAPLRVHSQSFHAWDYAVERGPDKLSAWNAGCSPRKSSCHYCFCLEKSAGDECLTFAWQWGVSDLHLFPQGCAPHRGKTLAIMQNL